MQVLLLFEPLHQPANAFLFTNTEQSLKEIKKVILPKIASKRGEGLIQ
jgi:hypothetical protein